MIAPVERHSKRTVDEYKTKKCMKGAEQSLGCFFSNLPFSQHHWLRCDYRSFFLVYDFICALERDVSVVWTARNCRGLRNCWLCNRDDDIISDFRPVFGEFIRTILSLFLSRRNSDLERLVAIDVFSKTKRIYLSLIYMQTFASLLRIRINNVDGKMAWYSQCSFDIIHSLQQY